MHRAAASHEDPEQVPTGAISVPLVGHPGCVAELDLADPALVFHGDLGPYN